MAQAKAPGHEAEDKRPQLPALRRQVVERSLPEVEETPLRERRPHRHGASGERVRLLRDADQRLQADGVLDAPQRFYQGEVGQKSLALHH